MLAISAGMVAYPETVQHSDSPVILWNHAAIEAAKDNNAAALVMVRALAIMHTAMFDAWLQYDSVAQPTLGSPHRRPANERMVANKQEAISASLYEGITGGNSGIGAAAARRVAELGAQVVVTGRRQSKGRLLVDAIERTSMSAPLIQTDLSQPEQVKRIWKHASPVYPRHRRGRFRRIDRSNHLRSQFYRWRAYLFQMKS